VGIAEAVSQALSTRKEVKALQFAYDIEKINMDIAERKYSDFMSPYKTQQINLEKALKNLEDGKKGIEMEVRANYLDLMQKQEEIKSGEKAVEVAKQALHLSEVSYDAGMSVLTDVEQAQVALQQARLGLSQAILDYNLMALKFEDSMGVGRTNSQK
ncbi:MAG: TolC family protein, partial [Firmicutes bacterium]|nr:TolC family protein [Bacillota bacterium]